jgi:phage shock protein A
MLSKVFGYIKSAWNWLLSKTTIDEKVIEVAEDVKETVQETVQETRRRTKRVKEEAADVVAAIKEVGRQAKDVADAAKGNKRKGRKPAPKKRTPRKSNDSSK